MVGIIITGHNNFATGILSAVKLVAGEQRYLEAVDFPSDFSTADLKSKLLNAVDSLNDCKNIIVFTDIVGGSPFKTSAEIAVSSDKNIKILSGTNLGMLIENVMMRDMIADFDELIHNTISAGKQQILKFEMKAPDEESDEGI